MNRTERALAIATGVLVCGLAGFGMWVMVTTGGGLFGRFF